jgi:hypothetical protein
VKLNLVKKIINFILNVIEGLNPAHDNPYRWETWKEAWRRKR